LYDDTPFFDAGIAFGRKDFVTAMDAIGSVFLLFWANDLVKNQQ
jgi:hypothetical protein